MPTPRPEERIVSLIERAAQALGKGSVRVPIGDDAAVLYPPPPGWELVATTDQVVENTHFRWERHPAGALGRKTLVRGLSDVAAMGATPAWFLLSLCLPGRSLGLWLEQYLEGMFQPAAHFGLENFSLAGGDIAQGSLFVAQIAVIGHVPEGRALLRSGARPGDRIYVSGAIGGSALGFSLLEQGIGAAARPAIERHLNPTPRLALGQFLREAGATACMDLSDGLSLDLARLAGASGVGAEIGAARIPRFPGASEEQALHGGEEYELLFTAPPSANIPEAFEDLPLAAIGEIRPGAGLTLLRDGQSEPLAPGGYEHFEER
jgi:thiamine-monophosphate kinase